MSTKAKLQGMEWDFSSLFREAVRSLPQRPIVKRDYLWASELGMDSYSLYLRMHAHVRSNPPGEQAQGKFIMGHFYEWAIGLILTMTGILKAKQLKGEVQLPGLLRVSGKLDFIAGGNVDWVAAREEVKKLQLLFAISMDDMPPIIKHAIDYVLNRMEMMFTRVPLREYIIEVKSCSRMVMNLIVKTGKPLQRQLLQPLHYLLANKNITAAQLLYASKDDGRMEGFVITPTKQLAKTYYDSVKTITDYYNNSGKNYLKNLPPKESEMLFTQETFTFQKNTNIQYSSYLTFGWPEYKTPEEFGLAWDKVKTSWNRTFKRCVTGAKMTALNTEVIMGAKKLFPEWDKQVELARKSGIFEKPETENEED